MKPSPPNISLKFLRWFCREDYIEEVEGDLVELFQRRYSKSSVNAKLFFFFNVLRHFRPEFFKTFQLFNYSNSTLMIRHNTLLALRNFKKYASSFIINLIGLSTGIACAILVYLWVADEVSIDKFHEKEGRIFQVMQNLPKPGDSLTVRSTPGLLADALKEEYPEVEYAASVITPDWFDVERGIVNYEEKFLQVRGQFAQPDYLYIFSWDIILGDREQVLSEKYAVVVSEELAFNLFGSSEDAIGKTIQWDQGETNGTYQVSGVFKKPPRNSTAQFDLLFNYQVFYDNNKENLDEWGNSNPDTYVSLKPGSNSDEFNRKIRNFARQKFQAANGDKYLKYIGTLFIRHFSDGYLYNTYENGQQEGGRISYVKLFSIIAAFIIGIACINFINLTTARASRRAKEIGVKKAVGANRSTLIFQFLVESFLITSFSVIVSLILVYLLLPSFNLLTGKQIQITFHLSVILLLMTILISFLSGLYPAFYLSHFNPARILKGNSVVSKSIKGNSEKFVRKGLVIFQFSISIVLIIAVVVVYKQIELIQTKNLGYNDDNVIVVNSLGRLSSELPTFVNEVKNIPGVIDASSFGHDMVGDFGATTGVDWPGRLPDQRIRFGNLEVGYNWIEMLEINLLEGRSFSDNYESEEPSIIFNQKAIREMGLEDPVGQTIKLWGEERQIIGVVEDFHFESLYDGVMPCFIQLYPELNSALIKIESTNTIETISLIEEFHKDFNNGLPFDYQFMDDEYQQLYVAEQRVATLSKYFAGIAILISSLGLLALTAYTTEKRQKEIGIRKVLGSSVLNIVQLLSTDFIKMVGFAILISVPLSYFLADQWLSSFAFRINLSWWLFAISGLAALAIAWFTVSLQTLKAANLNPVECLKDE